MDARPCGEDVRRCTFPQCSRPRLHDPQHQFTPLASQGSAGYDVRDYVFFARVCYCIGCKLPLDALCHMARDPDETVTAAEHRVQRYMNGIRLALSYKEVAYSQQVTFRNEVVEPDTGRAGKAVTSPAHRKKKQHTGRTLVLKGRSSRKWCAFALRAVDSRKGRGCPPERSHEVTPVIRKAVQQGCFLGSDGAKAWTQASSASKAPKLPGVHHQKKVFTPLTRLKKSALTVSQIKTLRAATKGKSPTAKEGKHFFWTTAGDNGAESTMSSLKQSLRRMGHLGRTQVKKPNHQTARTMAAAALAREAGLSCVLTALKLYREALSAGNLHLSPRQAFDVTHCQWLFADTHIADKQS